MSTRTLLLAVGLLFAARAGAQPALAPIPDQAIGTNTAFRPFHLGTYLRAPAPDVAWSYEVLSLPLADDPGGWHVNPAQYEHHMRFVASALLDGEPAGEGHVLAAFSGDTCRGLATPRLVDGRPVFFLVVYGEAAGEPITFRLFHRERDAVFALDDLVTFVPEAAMGDPEAPEVLSSGAALVRLEDDDRVEVASVDPHVFGRTRVVFTATDRATGAAVSDTVSFARWPDEAPVLRPMHDVIVRPEQPFPVFDLDHYLASPAPDSVAWSWTGGGALRLSVDAANRVRVTAPDGWAGRETIRFTATKQNAYRLAATDSVVYARSAVGTDVEDAALPAQLALQPNYPNPFNPSTEVAFDLPEAAQVRLVVYDVSGREVARLVDAALPPGTHHVRFEAGGLPSGTYLCRLTAGTAVRARLMTLLR